MSGIQQRLERQAACELLSVRPKKHEGTKTELRPFLVSHTIKARMITYVLRVIVFLPPAFYGYFAKLFSADTVRRCSRPGLR